MELVDVPGAGSEGGFSAYQCSRCGEGVVDGDVLARARADGWSFGQALKAYIFPPLGEGIARVPEVVADLLARGYDGWFVLEQDTTPGDPMVPARQNREYLEALLAGAAQG